LREKEDAAHSQRTWTVKRGDFKDSMLNKSRVWNEEEVVIWGEGESIKTKDFIENLMSWGQSIGTEGATCSLFLPSTRQGSQAVKWGGKLLEESHCGVSLSVSL